jgi:hypothetical protein
VAWIQTRIRSWQRADKAKGRSGGSCMHRAICRRPGAALALAAARAQARQPALAAGQLRRPAAERAAAALHGVQAARQLQGKAVGHLVLLWRIHTLSRSHEALGVASRHGQCRQAFRMCTRMKLSAWLAIAACNGCMCLRARQCTSLLVTGPVSNLLSVLGSTPLFQLFLSAVYPVFSCWVHVPEPMFGFSADTLHRCC